MSFGWPQALLLAIPAALVFVFKGRGVGVSAWLRPVVLALAVLALAQPHLSLKASGADVVVVVDRSRSMPDGADARAEEVIHLLEHQRRGGDRLAVVSFGAGVHVDQQPSATATFGGFPGGADPDGSDLSSALDTALELIPQERSGRILVVSDGRATGAEPRVVSRRAAARGVPIDFRWLERDTPSGDVAVVSLDVPASVARKEPFQLTASVHASSAVQAEVTLLRDGHPIARGERAFAPGQNLLTFHDLIEDTGLSRYELRVQASGDPRPDNDVGRAVLRVEGPPRILWMNASNGKGALGLALRQAGLEVTPRAPGPLTQADLEGVGVLVLEDVDANALGESTLRVIAQFVDEAGGGLLMTGGRHSFGEGGFRKSPIEPLLPVSLEVRQEQRKVSVAVSILMDCSCSMGATIPDGRTKMQLAGEGAVAALELLNQNDEASVDVVDTVTHPIFELTPVKAGLPLSKVASAFSGGGGIYIGEALRAGKEEILRSDKKTRHVVLFADAADSEEPGDYRDTLSALRRADVTVSVIGMGTEADKDAALLREIAERGSGRLYFAQDPASLPRIFSQEAMAVERAAFIDTPTAPVLGPDLPLLGHLPSSGWAPLGGYNLTYLKAQASVGLRSSDENKAPLAAFWPHGRGKVAAFTGEADGEYSGPFRQSANYAPLLEQLVRWSAPVLPPEASDLVVRSVRQGTDLHVTVDFDPAHPPEQLPTLTLLSEDGRRATVNLPLRVEGEDRLGAHVALAGVGSYHPVVSFGARVLRAPPVVLPYSPELAPAPHGEGHATLAALASVTQGVERLSVTELFKDTAPSATDVFLSIPLVALALLLWLLEVVVRRLDVRTPRLRFADPVLQAIVEPDPVPRPAPRAQTSAPPASAPPPERGEGPTVGAEDSPAPKSGMSSALEQAKARARRRTSR